jgi:HK97 family phage portal protein
LKAKHIRRIDGKIINVAGPLERLLQVRPNEYMNAYDFLYKIVSQLYSNNNAFVYMHTERGIVTGFYPLNYSFIEPVEYAGDMYFKFTFKSGYRMTVPYTELIHLRRHFNRDDVFGEDGRKPLKPTLDLINTINQGIVNAIKSSARLRGWLKYSGTLRPEDLKTQRDNFVTDYLGINNNGGIGALDAKADFTPAKMDPITADDKQMSIVRETAYRYFGVNEKIIQSNYTEDEWNAFYSSVLEPIALQLSLEMTSKAFTEREKGFGNEIVFSASRLTYASNATKVAMAKELMPMGIFTVNEMREIFELEPVEDGDKRLQTLNVVNAANADMYQLKGVKVVGERDPDSGIKSSTE